ncbi:MAG: hypothetical protein Fur0037_02140 [Planctomycetota bacterium]
MSGARRPIPAGFTLVELLVVAGLLAVLVGLGIGFLRGRDSGRGAMLSAIAGQMRAAALSARSTGLATEVRVEPGADGFPSIVRRRELVPITVFHFEPRERALSPVLRPTWNGIDEPRGRFGHCRRPDGSEKPVMEMPVEPLDFDLADGFAFRMDVRLERRESGSLLRLGRSFEIVVDEGGRLRVRLVQRNAEGRGGAAASLSSEMGLPAGRWVDLLVVHDGTDLRADVDGEELGRASASAPLFQQPGDRLEVSPGDDPFPGLVDEVRWFSCSWSDPVSLPLDFAPAQGVRVAFDADGRVLGSSVLIVKRLSTGESERLQVRRGGILE